MENQDKDINTNKDIESNKEVNNTYPSYKEKEWKETIKEQEKRIRELETYKQEVETKAEKEKIYQRFMFSDTEKERVNSLLSKYNIKNYHDFISDYHQDIMKNNKDELNLNNIAPSYQINNKDLNTQITQDIEKLFKK